MNRRERRLTLLKAANFTEQNLLPLSANSPPHLNEELNDLLPFPSISLSQNLPSGEDLELISILV